MVLDLMKGRKSLIVINKRDLGVAPEMEKKLLSQGAGSAVVYLSAKRSKGLDLLEEEIAQLVFQGETSPTDDVFVANMRHKKALDGANQCLRAAERELVDGCTMDLVAIDLREAWETLGEITGKVVTEDLLDRIFSEYCVGK
jgi:tRNA modification GTPase